MKRFARLGDVHEARIITEAAQKAGVATQMGTQIHAGNNYRRVVEQIQAGSIGPVREAHQVTKTSKRIGCLFTTQGLLLISSMTDNRLPITDYRLPITEHSIPAHIDRSRKNCLPENRTSLPFSNPHLSSTCQDHPQ